MNTEKKKALYDEVERRIKAETRTTTGANIRQITEDVAEENEVTYTELRSMLLDQWSNIGG